MDQRNNRLDNLRYHQDSTLQIYKTKQKQVLTGHGLILEQFPLKEHERHLRH